jgi:apolipoprotein N-acyltransferase
MRAAENRRWIVRSTNDGLTASIDPAGRVLQTLKPQIETSGRLQFSYVKETTVYSKYGDIFAWTCLALAAAFLVYSQMPSFSRGG